LIFVAFLVLFPIYATLMQSLKSGPDAIDHPKSLLPVDLTLDTLRTAWEVGDLGRLMANSIFVAVAVTLGVVITSLLAAYAFAFLDFPGKGVVFAFFLATLLVPAELTVVVNQRTMDSIGWIQRYQGLIVPLLATTFGTFLCGGFLTVPKDLREAAARRSRSPAFPREVAVPLCRPTLGALALFTFLGTWNQYLWPQAITTDDAHRTIQIGLERLKIGDIDKLNLVTAGTVIASIPIFVVLIAFQRQLVRGLTAGAVKG
jgi:sn-glycerol 3-phosphate transport system permease protein